MAESLFGRLQNGAVGFFTLVATIVGATVYGVNLKNDFDSAKAKVVQLETQVSELRIQLSKATVSNGIEGPRGERGPAGPKGDRGDPGPPGEIGPVGSSENFSFHIERLQKQIDELRPRPVSPNASAEASTNFMQSVSTAPVECVPYPIDKTSGTITLTLNTRLCFPDGTLIGRVDALRSDRFGFRYTNGSGRACQVGGQCDILRKASGFLLLDQIEKASDGGLIANFSIYSK